MATKILDEQQVEQFTGKMLDIMNSGALALMISIGHQTELFDVLAGLPPSTSVEIAQAAQLNERYVREWLGAMVTGSILTYDPQKQTYSLPPEHAALLTRAAGSGNLAREMPFIALLANVEADIIACFKQGGGVPYAKYPRFQQLMAEDSREVFDASLISTVLPAIPGLVERLQTGIDVLDVGCGQGHAINLMAQAYPASRFTGYDFSLGGIEQARGEAEQLNLTNARFVEKDLATLDAEAQFDFITAFDAIHDQMQPTRVLGAIARALRPDGAFLMVDIAASSHLEDNLANPIAPFMYTISCMHCMTVSLALGGEGLGAVWGKQKATQMLNAAGFAHVNIQEIATDPFNYYYITTK